MAVKRHETAAPVASPCTCSMLRRTARRVTRLYDTALRPVGLCLSQYVVLANVAREGGLSISELAERLGMDRTTLTRNLRPLVRSGWVLIATGSDRRQRSVGLTQAGRRLYAVAHPLWEATEQRLRSTLGDDAATLRRLLDTALTRTAAG